MASNIYKIVAKYKLPPKFLSVKASEKRFLRQVQLFKEHNMLWLLQRGYGSTWFNFKTKFENKFVQIKEFVESANENLNFFGFFESIQRDIIFEKLDRGGLGSKFIRDIRLLRIAYQAAELEVTDENRESLLESIRASSRLHHPLGKTLGRLMTRIAQTSPDRLGKVYVAMELSPLKCKVLPLLH